MKAHLRSLLFTLAVCLAPFDTIATVCSSNGNGLWTESSSWSCGSVPAAGDTVQINSGDTITIDQNLQYSGDILTVHVYGVLHFLDGGSKINLPCGSSIWIMMDGLVHTTGTGQGSSQTVRICNITYWTHDDGDIGGFEVWPGITLPVELISFNAHSASAGVDIQWITASETDVDHYRVHAVYPGTEEFLLGTVSASGNTTNTSYYGMHDMDLTPGIRYYRLLEVDANGNSNDLGIRSVEIRPSKRTFCQQQVAPDGSSTVLMQPAVPGNGPVEVFAMDGRTTVVSANWLQDGRTAYILPTSLNEGYYIARADDGSACMFKGGVL